MNLLLDQIEQSLSSGGYYLSLFTALTIPDIGGAMDASNGEATGARYKDWYEVWVRPQFQKAMKRELGDRAAFATLVNPLEGADCYYFRCGLLHQGRVEHPKSKFDRIMFVEPGNGRLKMHYSTMNNALVVDIDDFCREIIAGAREWLAAVEQTDLYKANYAKFVQRHPSGIAPYIVGVPVIG